MKIIEFDNACEYKWFKKIDLYLENETFKALAEDGLAAIFPRWKNKNECLQETLIFT